MAQSIPVFNLSVLFLIIIYFIKGNIQQEQSSTFTSHLSFDKYHDYDEMTEFLINFTEKYKEFTKLYSIGVSIRDRELWVVKVHNMIQNSSQIGIPHVKVIGNIHGNEPAGREVILHMIEYLVESYINGDQYIQWLLNNTEIHLLPSLNPDGFEVAREGVCGPSRGRDNVKGMDLNRNFPDFFRRNTRPVQPETYAVKRWLKNNTFVLSASLHGGSLVANYPFDNTPEDIWAPLYKVLNDANSSEEVIMLWKKLPHGVLSPPASPTPDDDVFHYLATLYARIHPTMHLGIPCKEGSKSFKDGAVNGASWYPLTGGMQDFNYVQHGCMEITLEISCCRYPLAKDLKQIWEENRKPLLTFISQAHRGVKGIVRTRDGQPVPHASIKVIGRNMSFNTSINGEFWRVLLPGNYLLQVEADGFNQKITPFEVPKVDNEMKPVHVRLDLILEPTVENSTSGTETVRQYNSSDIKIPDSTLTTSSPTLLASILTLSNNSYLVAVNQNNIMNKIEPNHKFSSKNSSYDIHVVEVKSKNNESNIITAEASKSNAPYHGLHQVMTVSLFVVLAILVKD
ncbi:carboxypeptidase D-like isoform X2 [Lycorma delicatula]|uniref:carboxypeptidase D-like isoform X2 n=1 Tax=Lycorma delicatula TaxID=130591 RepID=UPI003F510EEC